MILEIKQSKQNEMSELKLAVYAFDFMPVFKKLTFLLKFGLMLKAVCRI